ncbi:MAG: hypothetical protein MJH10_18815, partial [Epibacterium sp.]|nr:hypothetical protein [Epibacterium sp.]NQX75537.1 hypothetical protein [Epibacterium sp.]
LTQKAYNKGIDDLKKGLAESVPFVNNLGDAFGDFVARGFKDFKGFANSIKKEFQKLLSDMVSTALRNRLIIPLFGGPAAGVAGAAGAASAAGAAGGAAGTGLLAGASGFFGSLGAGGAAGTGLLGGAASVFTGIFGGAGVAGGGLAGGISAIGTALSGATSSIAGFGAAVGAIAVPLLAVTAVFSFFKKKVKILDSGLKLLVDGFDVVAKTFEKKEVKRYFGLSKKVKTEETELSSEDADPLKKAVNDLQTSIMDAADSLGLGATAWDQFTYEFKLSLKGLDEAARNAAIQEEMTKLGDAFASLTGHFETMEELLAASQQRFELNNRILALQGKEEELLAIRREAEMNATHELNRTLLARVHALEDVNAAIQEEMTKLNAATAKFDEAIGVLATTLQDALREAEQAASGALRNLSGAMASELSKAQGGVSKAQSDLAQAVSRSVANVNSGFGSILSNLNDALDVARSKAEQSRSVFELLDSSLRGRTLSSEEAFKSSRSASLRYVAGGGSDLDRLGDALSVLSEPTEQLFGTFQDYARDFSNTSRIIAESRDAAKVTLTADEQAVVALKEQIRQQERARDLQVSHLESLLNVEEATMSVEDAVSALDEALAHESLITSQHKELVGQFPELEGKVLSVEDAVTELTEALAHKELIESQHDELIAQFPKLEVALNQGLTSIAQAVDNVASAQSALAAAEGRSAQALLDHTNLLNSVKAPESATTTPDAKPSGGAADKVRSQIADLEKQYANASDADRWYYDQGNGARLEKLRDELAQIQKAPGFATGGMHSGGYRIVGERGPELESTGPSRVFSHKQTSSMFKDPDLREAVNELRREVSGLRSEQRQMAASNSKYIKRNYDINRKWDTEGLPQTRT